MEFRDVEWLAHDRTAGQRERWDSRLDLRDFKLCPCVTGWIVCGWAGGWYEPPEITYVSLCVYAHVHFSWDSPGMLQSSKWFGTIIQAQTNNNNKNSHRCLPAAEENRLRNPNSDPSRCLGTQIILSTLRAHFVSCLEAGMCDMVPDCSLRT